MNSFAIPLRGVGDSINVAINDLRIANIIIAKSYTKDTIIQLKDSLIKTQNIKINYLSNSYEEMKRYASASELARNKLENNLNKSKKKTKVITGVAGAFASAFLVLLLVK
jgi:hypothetical protein